MTTPPIIYRVTKDPLSHEHAGEFSTRKQAEKAVKALDKADQYQIIETRSSEPRDLQKPTERQTKEDE